MIFFLQYQPSLLYYSIFMATILIHNNIQLFVHGSDDSIDPAENNNLNVTDLFLPTPIPGDQQQPPPSPQPVFFDQQPTPDPNNDSNDGPPSPQPAFIDNQQPTPDPNNNNQGPPTPQPVFPTTPSPMMDQSPTRSPSSNIILDYEFSIRKTSVNDIISNLDLPIDLPEKDTNKLSFDVNDINKFIECNFITDNNQDSSNGFCDNSPIFNQDNTKVLVEISIQKGTITSSMLEMVLKNEYNVNDDITCYKDIMCSTYILIDLITQLSNDTRIRTIQLVIPVSKSYNNRRRQLSGSVISEGDIAMLTEKVRTEFNVDGSGIIIGVLSDSYDCLGGASLDIANGDLPSDVIILDDYINTNKCIDEGRAMLQIVHDIAPKAKLVFHTGFKGLPSFANGILTLANDANCTIIIDDVLYRAEPFFQDGVVAQAVDEVVTNNGVAFFSSVGNYGRSGWDAISGYVKSDYELIPGDGYLHQFGIDEETGEPIISNRLVLPNVNRNILFVLQWDSPFASAGGTGTTDNDMDIFIYYGSVLCGRGYTSNTSTGDAIESFSMNPQQCSGNTIDATIEVDVFITKFGDGPDPKYMRLVPLIADSLFEFPTFSSTSFGHDHATKNFAIGSAYYLETPEYGVTPPRVENFSSAGGAPIFFDIDGNRITTPEDRRQPRLIGPDGVATTFFGTEESDGTYRFFGTSAAVPHVGAVAALLLQIKPDLTPLELYQLLENTADDMDDPYTPTFDVGFDLRTGYGFINAYRAAQSLTTAVQPSTQSPTKSPISRSPTKSPSIAPTASPTKSPSAAPSESPTKNPTASPTSSAAPTASPAPTVSPTVSLSPSTSPSQMPTYSPSLMPSSTPSSVESLEGECSEECGFLSFKGILLHYDFFGFFCIPKCVFFFPEIYRFLGFACDSC